MQLAQPLCFCTTNNFVTTSPGCEPIEAITCADGTTCQPGSEGYTCGKQNPPVARGFVASANRQPLCVKWIGRSARNSSFGISPTAVANCSLLSPLAIGSCFGGEQAARGDGNALYFESPSGLVTAFPHPFPSVIATSRITNRGAAAKGDQASHV